MILTVKVSELFERVKEMHDDGMDYVDIYLSEEDISVPDIPLPPAINFTAWTEKESYMGIDYEEVEGTISKDA